MISNYRANCRVNWLTTATFYNYKLLNIRGINLGLTGRRHRRRYRRGRRHKVEVAVFKSVYVISHKVLCNLIN